MAEVASEFVLPKAGPTSAQGGIFGGKGPGAEEVASDIKVRILTNGDIELFAIHPGKEPERIVPTERELAYIKTVIDSREKAAKPPPGRKSADEERLTAAQADKAQIEVARALQPPPKPETIQVPASEYSIGPEGQTAVTKSVPQAQATYDLQGSQERRQAAAALLQQAQQAEANAIAQARVSIDRDQLTAQQARDKLNADLEKIRISLQQDSHALTARSQEITLRGQDADAGVSQRNTDVSAVSAGAGRILAGNEAMLPYLNAPGQIESYNSLMAGGPPVATKPVPPPLDPQQVYLGAMSAVQQQLPAQYVMPGAPRPVQPGRFVLPTG